MSTMTTEFAAPVSRTQMNFSLSIVRLVKEMHCGLTPALVSCWGDGKGASGQSRGARARDLGAIFVSSENSGCRARSRTDTTSLTVTGGVAMVD
jgi:hypothetical protein